MGKEPFPLAIAKKKHKSFIQYSFLTNTILLLLGFNAINLLECATLQPPNFNLAAGRHVVATSTCGEINGKPIREMYCTIAGASPYTPYNQYSYKMTHDESPDKYSEMRAETSFLQDGHNCEYCEANSVWAHPASNMVDGTPNWYQSPPLSRGMQYAEVNITFDLEQVFYVAHVWIQMANSPRPGTWILEHSSDFGKTYQPWQYFASSPAECSRIFGIASLSPLHADNSVVCTSEFSNIHPMDNGEIMINLLEGRPGSRNFSSSKVLQEFTSATNVRIRLLRPKTLQGHLMDLQPHGNGYTDVNDATVTRRYYYGIKEVIMTGRCICNGHAATCDILDPNRPRALLCRCEHNTEGENCERCKPGFLQKKWRQSNEKDEFMCEPCNCHGHSTECVYEEELAESNLSLDIHGQLEGGGRCLNCAHNTQGINCNECRPGFYRPRGKLWSDLDVCHPCICNPEKHTGNCAEESGHCECLPQFTGPNCDQCAPGFYHPPECRPCACNVNGTRGNICLPVNGKCPCKPGYSGKYCEVCAPGHTNITAGCPECGCDELGALNSECDVDTGKCSCKSNFGGRTCSQCAAGYFGHPQCEICDCDQAGSEDNICDPKTGQCLCKPGYAGARCDHCVSNFYGYPSCKECNCASGSKSSECDQLTGECPCYGNFTSRTCDKCAAGYYHYPDCFSCGCHASGSKGLTCDNEGQCYCKPNFEGKHCDRCKEKLYNFPICEECNCHPSGVIPEFAGCDRVPPGELCLCKENVMGRTCSQCKPNTWDLQIYHPKGCVDCACNVTGTVSLFNSCDQLNGACTCKRFAAGTKCDQCVEGYYNLQPGNHFGCEPCDCDVGGSIGIGCHPVTGQCRCKPRVEGRRCDRPIQDHYFPTLWHNKYEAEDGRLPDGSTIRYAINPEKFPNFSWRGFVVFSPIQSEIILDVNIKKSALYKLMLHYRNPTDVPVEVDVLFVPTLTQTTDFEQHGVTVLKPGGGVQDKFIENNKKEEQKFVLNPGRWRLHIKSQKRLFLDYIVLIPAEYYQASSLVERVLHPCKAEEDPAKDTCLELRYPPITTVSSSHAYAETSQSKFEELNDKGVYAIMEHAPVETLPTEVGWAVLVKSDPEHSKEVRVTLDVPEAGIYYLLVEYHQRSEVGLPIKVSVDQKGESTSEGLLLVNHCPYTFFCRDLLSANGRAAMLGLEQSPPPAVVTFYVQPGREFAINAVHLIKEDLWNDDFLKQVSVCVRKNGKCVEQEYPLPSKSIVTEAEAGVNYKSSISREKLPFPIAGEPKNLRVMSLDNVQSTLDIEGVVAHRGSYVFVIRYYNPDNVATTVDVLVQNERFADVKFEYCPSRDGCRAIVIDKQTGQNSFHLEERYALTLYANKNQKAPIYVDSVMAVPIEAYGDVVLRHLPLDLSKEFLDMCAQENLVNQPGNISDYCREKIFSLTTGFNTAALSCDCNALGSLDFACDPYGGQCRCKENVIGRTCGKCAPGFYNYPECVRCQCVMGQLCDETTGQCLCPRFVEGQSCDRCVQYAYGFDPLIGCQLCGCNFNGSADGELRCDPLNGQCLCKENVGGRQCDKCLPGYYGFPNCDECECEERGTVDDICDANTARCLCKKNVIGERCDQCRPGTFDLRKSDSEGCSECFCFHMTDRCRSSNWPIQSHSFDEDSWKVNDPNGHIHVRDGKIIYAAAGIDADGEGTVDSERQPPKNVYFEAPIPRADYTRAYGLHLMFTISSVPNVEGGRSNSGPDVKLISDKLTLEYWATEQPSNPSHPFKYVVTLYPEYWLHSVGEPASRAQLMTVLLKLEKVLIKASYYEEPKFSILEQFELEQAELEPRMDGLIHASSVESCQCPSPYTGPSCQLCAPGYYRVAPTSGSLLGACIPCNCHGHTGTCDPNTGLCLDCQHNTEGDHCELCQEGFYGNATSGSSAACLHCPCPYPDDQSNNAVSCIVSDRGILERCICREGYMGERCETCAPGYFIDPETMKCVQCDCNDNNDLTMEGACNPSTGDCALCEANTDGRHCEYCREWFYGDAVEAKNCTTCKCDQCGSVECNNRSGQCNCKPLVEGTNCNVCSPNAWGFNSCNGCQECNCGLAASNSQCDGKTGQCSCMPGATGKRCDQCSHGYWNYGSHGCTKCDCEADLSMGTVCDVNSGQCHCQQGATGPRCDQCLPSYLRIPGFGCRQCDECVFALRDETNVLEERLKHLEYTIGNVSKLALAGARVNRFNKQIAELEPRLEHAIYLYQGEGLNEVGPKVSKLKDSASAIAIRAERAREQLVQLEAETNRILGPKFNELRTSHKQLSESGRQIVRRIEEMRQKFEQQGDNRLQQANKDRLIAESTQKIASIRAFDVMDALKQAENSFAMANQTAESVFELKGKSVQLSKSIQTEKDRLGSINDMINDFHEELEKTKQTTANVKNLLDSFSLFNINALSNGIEKDSSTTEQNIKTQKDIQKNITRILQTTSEIHNNIKDYISELTKLKSELESTIEAASKIRRRRDPNKKEYIRKVEALEAEAKKIISIFNSTKRDTHVAIEAANIYRDVVEILKNTGNSTGMAKQKATEARKLIKSQLPKSKFVNQRGRQLLADAEQLQVRDFNELKSTAEGINRRLEQLSVKINQNNADFAQINITTSGRNKAEELSEVREKAEQVFKGLVPVNESLVQMSPAIADLDTRVKHLIEWTTGMTHASNTARDQIQQVDRMIPETKDEWDKAKKRLAATIALMEEQQTRLSFLKEKIAAARDKANRIKLGARFKRSSTLALPIPQPSINYGMFTQIRFFFKAMLPDGFMLFLGSENANAVGEYLAIELEDGLPKLTLNFGSQDPVMVALSENVNDNKWREMSVERIGRRAVFKVTRGGSEEIADEQTVVVPRGRTVLDLFDDYRKLFIGAVPPGIKMPKQLQQHSFVGDMDKLRINGEQIGFWNSEYSANVTGAEMRPLLDSERSSESGATFNGKGYMQFLMGPWNPRKRTAILLSFITYSPDGLLFFVGKDRDQLILELVNGRVSLSFDLGSGPGKLMSNGENYNDGKWHLVQVDRVERSAKLKVDDSDKVEGESPGERFEMSISDSFFIGGLPQNIETRFTVEPFRGCIRNLKLDTEYVSFSRPKSIKGAQPSCVNQEVREVTFVSERSFAKFSGLGTEKETDIELAFRFRAGSTNGRTSHVTTLIYGADQEEVVSVNIEENVLVVRSNGNEEDQIRLELLTPTSWHYIVIVRTRTTLSVTLDDTLSKEISASDLSDVFNAAETSLIFGRYTPPAGSGSAQHFIGCVGDVILSGKLLNFAQCSSNELKLVGCTISAISQEVLPSASEDEKIKKLEGAEGEGIPEATTTIKVPKGGAKSRPDGACALPIVPFGEREDSGGYRFGLQPGSRIEFDFRESPIEQDLDFSIQLRATASNGIIFFVSNEKHSNFIVLYMTDGRIAFSFGSGHHKFTIKSNESLLDDEWHMIRVEREGNFAALYVDDKLASENRASDFGEIISVQQPLYIGGLPTDLVPFASRILPWIKSEFGGCLRGMRLNGYELAEEKGQTHGAGKCSMFTEEGIYFGKDGGYAIINSHFVVGMSFSLEMEVKPRTKNAVLLSVGVLEFLALQILNGTVKFSVDNGAGVESVVYDPPFNNTICDGHWHRISLYKKKNLITLNVDGKSNLRIMKKKSASETSTRDPLYLGGVPKDIKLKGLDTVDPYVGCIRIMNIGRKQRKRDVDPSEFSYFGAVDRKACPLN